MQRGALGRLGFVLILALIFVLWPAREASGFGTTVSPPVPAPEAPAPADPSERLTEGFRRILDFFAARNFSLLSAWREMRASGDPAFFEKRYPAISRELDAWAASLESRFGVPASDGGGLDFTFLLHEFGPVILDPRGSSIMRDNALATVCMVCLMDGPRCDTEELHSLLAGVMTGDTSAARRAEAMRWWRRGGDSIDEALIGKALAPPAGLDPDVRSEAARILFSIRSEESLRAQRLLISTAGTPPDPAGMSARIACEAIRRVSAARFEEAVPDLIRALSDPSVEVRACAAESLGVLTGRDFGFVPGDQGPANLEAIARWRAWWREHGSDTTAGVR